MLRKNLDDLDQNGKRGDWAFMNGDLNIAVRYGENAFAGTVVLPIGSQGWTWDGNKESPTLTPSILVKAVPGWTEGWHGFLTGGRLVDC